MAIQLQCDECFTELAVPEKFAGKKVKCKECGAVLHVPAPGETDETDEFDDAAERDEPELPRRVSRKRPGKSAPSGKKRGSAGDSKALPAPIMWAVEHPKTVWAAIFGALFVIGMIHYKPAVILAGILMAGSALAIVLGFLMIIIYQFVKAPWLMSANIIGMFVGFRVRRYDSDAPEIPKFPPVTGKLMVGGLCVFIFTMIDMFIIMAINGPPPAP